MLVIRLNVYLGHTSLMQAAVGELELGISVLICHIYLLLQGS